MQAFLKSLAGLLLAACSVVQAADDPAYAVIAHAGVPRVDAPTLQRLYMGRAIEVAGTPVTVVNLASRVVPRDVFLTQVVNIDEDRYISYWTVRRHVGKGAPPREFRNPTELIEFVQSTPGAIGYVSAADLKPGVNIVYRPKP